MKKILPKMKRKERLGITWRTRSEVTEERQLIRRRSSTWGVICYSKTERSGEYDGVEVIRGNAILRKNSGNTKRHRGCKNAGGRKEDQMRGVTAKKPCKDA